MSQATVKQILLRELGPSPSREELSIFVSKLSKEERSLFLATTPEQASADAKSPPAATPQSRAQSVSPSPFALRYSACAFSLSTPDLMKSLFV